MKLYHDPNSRSVRVHAVLEEIGVPYELVPVSLKHEEQKLPAHRERHPLAQLPVLEDRGMHIFESVAICLYLADRYPEARLAPDPASPERGPYLQWCLFVPGSLEPALTRSHLESTTSSAPSWLPKLDDVFEALTKQLSSRSTLLLSGYSVADVVVGTTLHQLEHLGAPLPEVLTKYVTNLRSRPAVSRAWDEMPSSR